MSSIVAYTDGSANWRNGLGGYGAYIKYPDGSDHPISEGLSQTKTGRAEIRAVLAVLRHVPYKSKLHIHSDSEYVVKAFLEDRTSRWLERDFVGIKNSDLWLDVLDEIWGKGIEFSIEHIKGHQKVTCKHTEGNFYADGLADYKNFEDYERLKDISDEDWAVQKSNKGG